MNLVPWFPEIAVIGGAVALLPALVRMRTATRRPVPATYATPGVVALIGLVLLDGLFSARTGASFALGVLAALAIQWMADFGVTATALGLSAWGASVLGLGLVFELFGSAAGMDDGGWKFFAQLVVAFALGSSLITATKASEGSSAESADAGVFATAGAVVIAAGTPFVANRVDGVAFPMLVATAGLCVGGVALVWKGSRPAGLIAGAVVLGLLVAVAASGLDPVALGMHEAPIAVQAPLLAGLAGTLLGVVIRLIDRAEWTVALVALAVVPFHFLGTYAVAVGALALAVGVALPAAPGRAATVFAILGILAASRSGAPLIAPSHWGGWVHTFLAAVVVGGIGALGKGPRVALLRVAILVWIVIAPFVQ